MKFSSREIKLSNGLITLVDEDDFEQFGRYLWGFLPNGGYARRSVRHSPTKTETFLLHRLIMKCPKDMVVDHMNHDGLDNRKANLRICTKAQNTQYQRLKRSNTSGYKGVCWDKRRSRFQVSVDCKVIGHFQDAVEAARAYDKRAKMLYGEFAILNFPDETISG